MHGELDILRFMPSGARQIGVSKGPVSDDFFAWEIFKSFLDGVSPIDLTTFPIASLEAAQDFLLEYGVDLNDSEDRQEASDVYGEALEYLHRVLCPAPADGDIGLTLPVELTEVEDLPRLLLLASQDHPLQPWACALLRLMHTINHANHAVRSPFYSQIKEQILGKYRAHLHQDGNGNHVLGRGLDAVPLRGVFFREEKSRESLILKLLHKPDNVAQSVFDRIGIKLVVGSDVDALLVLRYFRRQHLAIFANITPGRSRNTLVDLEQFQEEWWANGGDAHPAAALKRLRHRKFKLGGQNGSAASTNPHSGPGFRSIQFTCRQLIRLVNPLHGALRDLQNRLDQHLDEQTSRELLSELKAKNQDQTLRFFFPYEVQIMDEENYIRSETGEASHAKYRLRQMRSARRRVLGRLLLGSAQSPE